MQMEVNGLVVACKSTVVLISTFVLTSDWAFFSLLTGSYDIGGVLKGFADYFSIWLP